MRAVVGQFVDLRVGETVAGKERLGDAKLLGLDQNLGNLDSVVRDVDRLDIGVSESGQLGPEVLVADLAGLLSGDLSAISLEGGLHAVPQTDRVVVHGIQDAELLVTKHLVEILAGNLALQTIADGGAEDIGLVLGDVLVGSRTGHHRQLHVLAVITDGKGRTGEHRSLQDRDLIGGVQFLNGSKSLLLGTLGILYDKRNVELVVGISIVLLKSKLVSLQLKNTVTGVVAGKGANESNLDARSLRG